MRNKTVLILATVLSIVASGCTPRVRVRKSPGPKDTGIRYYRPKPYLKVTPAGSVVTEGKVTTTTPSDEFVSISLEYLPDFSEEYSIKVCPGLGSANVDIGLENGWNLTSVNQELDSEFDDNVKAIAEVAGAASAFVPTAKGLNGPPVGSEQKFVVAATNVPIGYYESVISADACGKKRLFGFRYIGFLPFSSCPTEMCGEQRLSCQTMPSDLYGIVFREGVMRFERLDSIDGPSGTRRTTVSTGRVVVTSVASKIGNLESAVRWALLESQGLEADVQAELADDGGEVEIAVQLDDPAKLQSRLIKDIVTHEGVEESLAALGNPIPGFRAETLDRPDPPQQDLPNPAENVDIIEAVDG